MKKFSLRPSLSPLWPAPARLPPNPTAARAAATKSATAAAVTTGTIATTATIVGPTRATSTAASRRCASVLIGASKEVASPVAKPKSLGYELRDINRMERQFRASHGLNPREIAILDARLDRLERRMRTEMRDDQRYGYGYGDRRY